MRFLLLFLLSINFAFAQQKGKIVRVKDGDSYQFLAENNQLIEIRLYGVDCPEHDQPMSKEIVRFVKKKTLNQTVTIQKISIDKYKRTVANVILADNSNLAELLLRNGWAWHYKKYDKNPNWTNLELIARKKKIGIWKMTNPVAPWEWRKAH